MTPVDYLTHGYLRAVGAKSRWVTSPHGPLHGLDVPGSGDLGTIVLLHGLSARGTHFAPFVRHLRRHFSRLVIPDLLGHGRSTAPPRPMRGWQLQEAMNHLIDALVEEPCVLYGNSLGGYCAIRLAARRPQQMRALVVNSPAGAALQDMSISAYLDRFRVRTHPEAVAFLDEYFGEPIRLRRVMAFGVLRQLRSPDVQGFIDHICPDDFLNAAHFDRLSMPVLCIWGQNDGIMVPEQLAFFRSHLPPHAQLVEPPEYGHAPYIEHPADLAGRLLAFTRAHPSPAPG